MDLIPRDDFNNTSFASSLDPSNRLTMAFPKNGAHRTQISNGSQGNVWPVDNFWNVKNISFKTVSYDVFELSNLMRLLITEH